MRSCGGSHEDGSAAWLAALVARLARCKFAEERGASLQRTFARVYLAHAPMCRRRAVFSTQFLTPSNRLAHGYLGCLGS